MKNKGSLYLKMQAFFIDIMLYKLLKILFQIKPCFSYHIQMYELKINSKIKFCYLKIGD